MKPAAQKPSLDPATIRVIIVDDDKDILRLWSTLLRREGYEVVACSDPWVALRAIAEQRVDILLADHSMPGLTGVELLALASRLHPGVVRLMATAHVEREVLLAAVNEGHAERFLPKPCPADALRSAVREAAWQVTVRRRSVLDEATALATSCGDCERECPAAQ